MLITLISILRQLLKVYKKIFVSIDIVKKTAIPFLSVLFLSGCIETTALLGPAVTVGSSGNIYQASLSYGANQAIKKTTGKTPVEHVVKFFDPQNEHQGDLKSILIDQVKETELEIKKKEDDFFVAVKKLYKIKN